MSRQQSNTRGKQSSAKKQSSTRHGFEPMPATSKVGGASGGNEPEGRTATEVMDQYTAEEMARDAERENEKSEGVSEESAIDSLQKAIKTVD